MAGLAELKLNRSRREIIKVLMFLVELRFNCFFVFYEQRYGVIAKLVLTYSHLRDQVAKDAHNFVPHVSYSTNF
jgi:hypothetical protein